MALQALQSNQGLWSSYLGSQRSGVQSLWNRQHNTSAVSSAQSTASGGLGGLWNTANAGRGALSALREQQAASGSAVQNLWSATDTAGSQLAALHQGQDGALNNLWAAEAEKGSLSSLYGYAAKETEKTETTAASTGGVQAAVQATAGATVTPTIEAEAMRAMNTGSAAARGAVRASYNLAELYRFQNQYLYGTSSRTWARIDANTDGVWDYAELSAYADAYRNATGRTLDVDALMARYSNTGDNTGTINYTQQNQMYADDALGIARFKDDLLYAEYYQGMSSGTERINDKALDSFVEKYTYGNANKLYAAIDKDEDGVWSKAELTNYADAYYKATGIKLDVDALFAKYDKEGKGYLNYFDQNEMYRDDALGLGRVSDALNARKSESGSNDDKSLSGSIKDAMSQFDRATLSKLFSSFSQSIMKSMMLDSFMMTNNLINSRGMYRNNYGLYSYWNMYSFGMMSLLR